MQVFELEEIKSGEEDDYHWVTLGFRSELEAHDVLHIVCPKGKPEDGGGIYLERFDQAYAAENGLKRLDVGKARIELKLNETGTDRLDLEAKVAYVIPPRLAGWEKALAVFRAMRQCPCGGNVGIED